MMHAHVNSVKWIAPLELATGLAGLEALAAARTVGFNYMELYSNCTQFLAQSHSKAT